MRLLLILPVLLFHTVIMAQPDTLVIPMPPVEPMSPAAPAPTQPPTPPAPPSPKANADSTVLEEGLDGDHRLELGIGKGKGVYAEVKPVNDPQGQAEGDTIKITTKNKLIRIITEDREIKPEDIDVEQRIQDARVKRRNQFTYWSGLDLGFNTLLGPDGDADLDPDADFMQIENGRSRFFAINFMERKFEFGSHHVGLTTGLGLEFLSYHLTNNVQLAYDADSTFGIPIEDYELRKNKLGMTGLRLPLMLEFNTKRAPLPTEAEIRSRTASSVSRKGNVHIAMGVVGSWYFDTMYKQKYKIDGENRKDRYKGDLNLLPYRAAATVRVGYGGLNLFAEYGLTELFEGGKGPALTPLNIGLTIIGFN